MEWKSPTELRPYSEVNYIKEKSKSEEYPSDNSSGDRAKSELPSHHRKRSPNRKSRWDHDDRREFSDTKDRKINITENRRLYVTKDRFHEKHSSYSTHPHHSPKDDRFDDRKSPEHNQRGSRKTSELIVERVIYCKDNSSEKIVDKPQNERDEYNDVRSSERNRDRSFEKNDDYHRPRERRSSSRERRYSSPKGYNSRRSARKTTDQHDSKERFYNDDDHYHKANGEYHNFPEKAYHTKSSETHIYGPSQRSSNYYQANDERHISYRSASGNEEFIASLFQKIDFLSNQIDHLSQENEKLKHSANSGNDESAAEVFITFGNKRFEEKFLPILKEVATDLITGQCSVEALASFLESSEKSQFLSESWNPEGELFSLDLSCDEPKESSSVPRYNKSFSEVLQTPEELVENSADEKKDLKKMSKTCFNCDGDHFLGECPHPMNPRRIANARKRFKPTFVPNINKRYHVYGSQESDYKPGVISDELRKALSLQKNQVPHYIYRMRVLDYPPGWLAEATVESSGIALYDSEGVAQIDESNENTGSAKVEYDSTKLIDYPGFNSPLPPECIDESSALGLPPMQSYHLRDYIEQALPKPEPPSRKRKLLLPEPKNSKSIRLEENMEIDDDIAPSIIEFNPPLPDENLPPPPPDDPPDLPEEDREQKSSFHPDSDSQSDHNTPLLNLDQSGFTSIIEPFKLKGNLSPSSGTQSPSLRELEEMKKRLVLELSIAADSSTSALDLQDNESESPKTIPTSLSEFMTVLDSNNELSNFSDSSFSSKASGSNKTASNLKRTDSVGSRLISLGTPSISRHSSFSKLPSYENFSKDVTSHLNFENLPNSTGTYEKMKKVIKKVKQKINSLMQ